MRRDRSLCTQISATLGLEAEDPKETLQHTKKHEGIQDSAATNNYHDYVYPLQLLSHKPILASSVSTVYRFWHQILDLAACKGTY